MLPATGSLPYSIRPAESRAGSGYDCDGARLRDLERSRPRLLASFSSFSPFFFSYRPVAAAVARPAPTIGSACLRRLLLRERSPFRAREWLRTFSTMPATAAPAKPAPAMCLRRSDMVLSSSFSPLAERPRLAARDRDRVRDRLLRSPALDLLRSAATPAATAAAPTPSSRRVFARECE